MDIHNKFYNDKITQDYGYTVKTKKGIITRAFWELDNIKMDLSSKENAPNKFVASTKLRILEITLLDHQSWISGTTPPTYHRDACCPAGNLMQLSRVVAEYETQVPVTTFPD